MANISRTLRTHEEIKAANEAYLKTKGITNTPSDQRTEAEIQAAAYNPGRSVYMRQGTIDARRTGRPIGTPGYPPAAWQVGKDVHDRGLYNRVEDPAMKAAGFTGLQAQSYAPQNRVPSYFFDSQNPSPAVDMASPAQIAANRAAVQARLAALTKGNQAPASMGPRLPSLPGQMPSTFGGDRRLALANSALPKGNQAPASMGPRLPSLPGQMPSTFGGDRRLALATGPLPPVPVISPVTGESHGMVANPGVGGLGVPNVIYRFSDTPAEKEQRARQRREWDDLYGDSLTRDDLSRKLAARKIWGKKRIAKRKT